MDKRPVAFNRRLILGVRAAGLLLTGIGIAAPALLVGVVLREFMTKRAVDPFAAFGTIDRVGQVLRSKAVLTEWLSLGCVWLVALVCGVDLIRSDAMRLSRLVRRFT